LNLAFELRQKADYREFFIPSHEQANQTIEWAQIFVAEVRGLIGNTDPPPATPNSR